MPSQNSSRTVNATKTSFEVIEALRELDGAGITDLANHLDMAKSTVHSHISTLEEMEYIVKEGSKYEIGFKFLRLGEHTREQKKAYRMAKPIVKQLAEETNERSQFITEEYGLGVFVHRQIGQNAVHTNTSIGKRIYLHSTGAGKAILAHLPPDRIQSILDTIGLPAQTQNTITNREELYQELEKIRERGYAFNKEEGMDGLRTVGVPILAPDNNVFGAFSVSGPTYRMNGERLHEQIPNLLRGKANEFELKIEFEL
ncbi:IclR family transcriptional regulator [Halalkalirubrum salinum]|uniref:IclR family transcriptional regulator n=1 Tax=Halalkalirubrum salinum TaxID=2563889 RepID=UPI0010FB3A40|nr:IclR family transcriptional regulator [Halalkalirubrum salinum]